MSFIKKIRIKNFKNLEDVEIDVKPLTFLFGPNGSGKSSFIKAMMFLSKNLFPLNTGKTIYKISDDVDLGSYRDIVTNNDVSKKISFEIDISGEYQFPKIDFLFSKVENIYYGQFFSDLINENFFKVFSKITNDGNFDESGIKDYFEFHNFDYTASIDFNDSKINYNLKRFQIKDNLHNSKYEFAQYIDNKNKRNAKEKFEILNNKDVSKLINHYLGYESVSSYQNLTDSKAPEEYYVFNPQLSLFKIFSLSEVMSVNFNYDIFSIIKKNKYISVKWNNFKEIDKIKYYYELLKFSYLSNSFIPFLTYIFFNSSHIPLTRKIPNQKYLLDRNDFDEYEYYGFFKFLDSKLFNNKNSIINSYIKKYDFGEEVLLEKKHGIGSMIIKDKAGRKINVSNSSSGFIQVFPIIIMCCNIYKLDYQILKNNFSVYDRYATFIENNPLKNLDYYTLLIEQPELHLHPKLQSKLAELFSETIKDSDNNMFIETHSEHLIRKIQVLIANDELDRDKVSVMYFDNNEGSTKIKKMEIEENGFFKVPWPYGFFDDSANLSWELLTANKN